MLKIKLNLKTQLRKKERDRFAQNRKKRSKKKKNVFTLSLTGFALLNAGFFLHLAPSRSINEAVGSFSCPRCIVLSSSQRLFRECYAASGFIACPNNR